MSSRALENPGKPEGGGGSLWLKVPRMAHNNYRVCQCQDIRKGRRRRRKKKRWYIHESRVYSVVYLVKPVYVYLRSNCVCTLITW